MADRSWLSEYADTKSAAAFARLVREHGPLVYSTCLREVRDPHLAEDVAQVVFLLLARKLDAGAWRPRTVLAGWLYETARFASRNALRRERRRRARETKAVIDMLASRAAADGRGGGPGGRPRWEEIEPLLNAALGRLRRKDRDAILLRYYQDKPLKEVGAALGVSADAAQARVTRALEKLRQSLARSGVAVTATTFPELLRANAAGPAPPGLLQGVVEALARRSGQAAGGTAAASRVDVLTEGVARAMALLAVQKIVAVVACATVMVSAVVAANRDERDPAALAILEKFGEEQAKLRSFVVRSEDTSRWSGGETEAPPVRTVRQSVNEFRADARTGRFARRFSHWGDALPDATLGSGGDGERAAEEAPALATAVANSIAKARQVATREQPDYTSTLWDGAALYTYGRANPGTPDRLTIVRGNYDGEVATDERLEREVRTGYAGAATMGYFHLDDERIDRAAKRASYIRLRPDRETVNGVDCHVIEMCADGGNYTLWIDPEHGFQIVRCHAMKLPGDVVAGRKLGKGCRIGYVVEISRLEQVDGVWVPMEAKEEVHLIFPNSPTPAQRGSMTHRKTLVNLNPDFDATGAFKPDDVRDGTLVSESTPGGKVKRAVWRGGVLEPLSF
jgi:RNA polymerase sigma factor (sigma-70 family)